MKLTPHLEKLIFEGKAAFKTYCMGGGNVYRIPCPKENYIVIIGFDWAPFNDYPSGDIHIGADILNFIFYQLHQMVVYSSKNKFQWNFRDPVRLTQDPVSLDPTLYQTPGDTKSYDCFMIFDENVRVNISEILTDPRAWANVDFGAIPDNVDELSGPMYAGTVGTGGANVLRSFQLSAADTAVTPLSFDILPGPAASRAVAADQFETRIIGLNSPNGFANNSGVNYPLINFQYVQVFEPLPENIRR